MSNEDISQKYHEWYYNARVWEKTTFMGIECLKSVSDMWNYQEIIFKLKPSLVVEFGTFKGGATLYFLMMLKRVNPKGKVFTVDINLNGSARPFVKTNPNIIAMDCSSTDPKVVQEIVRLRTEQPGPVFFILDSDHSKKHVLAEMESLRSITVKGDYLVVEDSNINGNPILPEYGEGPMEAITEYFTKYPNDYLHDYATENKFGFTFAPNGFLIRK